MLIKIVFEISKAAEWAFTQASKPHRTKALAPIEAGSPLAFEAAKAESGPQRWERRVGGRAPKKKVL